MMPARPAAEARVAERAARSGAALLLIAMLVTLLAGGSSGQPAGRPRALRLDPNTASRAELMLLPGIGPARADALLAERGAPGGAVDSQDDLDRMHGFGPRRIELLTPHLLLPSATHEQP